MVNSSYTVVINYLKRVSFWNIFTSVANAFNLFYPVLWKSKWKRDLINLIVSFPTIFCTVWKYCNYLCPFLRVAKKNVLNRSKSKIGYKFSDIRKEGVHGCPVQKPLWAKKADTSNVIKSSPSSFFAAHASMEMTTFSNLHHHHHSLANCPENHQSSPE